MRVVELLFAALMGTFASHFTGGGMVILRRLLRNLISMVGPIYSTIIPRFSRAAIGPLLRGITTTVLFHVCSDVSAAISDANLTAAATVVIPAPSMWIVSLSVHRLIIPASEVLT